MTYIETLPFSIPNLEDASALAWKFVEELTIAGTGRAWDGVTKHLVVNYRVGQESYMLLDTIKCLATNVAEKFGGAQIGPMSIELFQVRHKFVYDFNILNYEPTIQFSCVEGFHAATNMKFLRMDCTLTSWGDCQ